VIEAKELLAVVERLNGPLIVVVPLLVTELLLTIAPLFVCVPELVVLALFMKLPDKVVVPLVFKFSKNKLVPVALVKNRLVKSAQRLFRKPEISIFTAVVVPVKSIVFSLDMFVFVDTPFTIEVKVLEELLEKFKVLEFIILVDEDLPLTVDVIVLFSENILLVVLRLLAANREAPASVDKTRGPEMVVVPFKVVLLAVKGPFMRVALRLAPPFTISDANIGSGD
jgi:hypothetical protein